MVLIFVDIIVKANVPFNFSIASVEPKSLWTIEDVEYANYNVETIKDFFFY